MTIHLGHFNTATTRTHVRFHFSTHAAAGANVAPSSAIDAADIRIYKAADSAAFSATQRSSANGITVTSPFDSLTGFHDVDIDLTDNTDAGFFVAGSFYSVVLAPNDETIDSQVITGAVLAVFEIGVAKADVTQLLGTAWLTPGTAGTPDVNAKLVGGTAQTGGDLKTLIETVDNFIDTEIAALQTSVDDIPTNAELATSQATADDATLAAIAALNNITAASVWAAGTRTLTAGTNIDGSTFSAIPWNAAWDAEVQSEAADALNAYDPPTNAEMEARTLVAASYATAAALDAVDNFVDTEIGAIQTTLAALFTTALVESYAADGAPPTVAQSLMLIQQALTEGGITGTSWVIDKLDGTTPAATITLDSATTPTSKTRSA